jgi:uncharacterized membrane protein
MRTLVRTLDTGSRAAAVFLGGLVVCLAAAAMIHSVSVKEIAAWAGDVLGVMFSAMTLALVFVTAYAWIRIVRNPQDTFWYEAGMCTANAVATLALVYTLLGIALGVGGLAHQDLTPQTVTGIVRDLTRQFSLAFFTTVVGLPLSTVLRVALHLTHVRNLSGTRLLPAPQHED